MLNRLHDNIEKHLKIGKVLVIYGPRRVGKTTLIQNFLRKTLLKYKFDIGDSIKTQEIFSSQDPDLILEYAKGYELIVIDEAQFIPNIGSGLKILVDKMPNIKVIATGSSSFDMSNKLGEPLTGRKKTITLFPIAQLELATDQNKYDLKQQLENFLIYGSYPEVITIGIKKEKSLYLEELINSYLYKDILELENIKYSKTLNDLVKMLAFQIGNEVSLNELATNLSIDIKTVEKYLDLLEKSFVIVSVGALSRNLRGEIRSKRKYYFFDNGIRNAVISQFNSLDLRNDIGALWENFMFIERLKYRSYNQILANMYFWRTYDQKEVDLVEESNGILTGFEFKWNEKKQSKHASAFLNSYKNANLNVVNKDNYLDFIL